MVDDTFVQQLRDTFKGKRVLIIGDSICRGLYKDICCVLNNNSRLLCPKELIFNRHNIRANTLFGEKIDSFCIDRTNSTLNQEKRIFQSDPFNYYVCYIFNSRVWNTQMNNILSSIKENYDLIILQSFIWDITRYNDIDGSLYLNNLDKCLSKLQELNKPSLWILLPRSASNKAAYINNCLTKLSPTIIQKIQQHSVNLLNLSDSMKNEIELRHNDGVHFTPSGYRHITQQIGQSVLNLQQGSFSTSSIELPPVVNNTSSVETTTSPDVIRGPNRFISNVNQHKVFNRHRIRSNNNNNHNNNGKKVKLESNEAEQFGIAFGTAWKTYSSFE